ncbi:tRNA 4-thiouridine(8) synthase ThiI [Candidatus Parcubacteria bacterium]|nr:tRNA 4-thiouridine(8) synthase ThiI [Candidatus Parcubacteria bacterium]
MPKTKALVLFSGGLDSILAVKMLQAQKIAVTAICFTSNFFNAELAKESARNLEIPILIKDISGAELKLVKNPPHGYGKHLNPCIDCHAMMIRLAGEIARKQGFDFVATGEVLGQRPFSQNKKALGKVKNLSGVEVVRPLSAKLLDETEIEKNKILIRGLLGRIKGRSREEQIELARRYKLKNYPLPAGGCLLTDSEFSKRLIKLLGNYSDCDVNDVEIIKNGRVFWLKVKENTLVLAVVGRNHKENEKLKKLAKKGDFIVELKEITGPSALVRFINLKKPIAFKSNYRVQIPKILSLGKLRLSEPKNFKQIFDIICLLTGYYSTKARNKEVELIVKNF